MKNIEEAKKKFEINRSVDDCFCFENGVINYSLYSYYIDSVEDDELSEEETRELYEAMKNYYEDKDNG